MPDHERVLAYFTARQDEMLDVVRQLVMAETPSSDKPRLDAFAEGLAQRLQAVGAEPEIVPVIGRGNHIRARFGYGAAKPALILCHYDTVWPVGSLETHPFRIDGGKAYGPGIFDMQSSLMLTEFALAAVGDLELTLPRPVTVLITSDEEVGSLTSRELIEEEAKRSAYVLVMESPLPGGKLKTTRKGVGRFTLNFAGRAAHAGVEPEKGASAIQELAQQVLYLHALTDPTVGTTVNVGVVQGGTVPNVIAAHAQAEVDARAWTQAEADRIMDALLSLQPTTAGVTVQVEGGWNRPPLERTATGELFERAKELGKAIGLDLQEGGTGGGSDGNFTGALGIPTLDGLGVPGHGAHADHEHIEVDKIPSQAALLVLLLSNL